MEYYSSIKKNKTMPSAATWMEPETLIPKGSFEDFLFFLFLPHPRHMEVPSVMDETKLWLLPMATDVATPDP